jgi:hypothetical protein
VKNAVDSREKYDLPALISVFILALIDSVERFSRLLLIFGALHLAIVYSGYRESFKDYPLGLYLDPFFFIFLMFMVFLASASFQHFYLFNQRENSLVARAKDLFKQVKKAPSPAYLNFSKFLVLGSTLIQYFGLIFLLLIFGYYWYVPLSFLIILVYSIFVFIFFPKKYGLEKLSPTFSQTIIFLIHVVMVVLFSFHFHEKLDIFLIFWLFALRATALYLGQLVHLAVFKFKESGN